MITEHDRKLAETLGALSSDPVDDSRPSKRNARRLAFYTGFIALVAAGVLAAAFYQETAFYQKPDVVPEAIDTALTAPAIPPDIAPSGQPAIPGTAEITGSGFVVAPRMTTVFASYGGRITHIAVQEGDAVAAGLDLVTLNDAGTRFALEQAKAVQVAARLVLKARLIDLEQAQAGLDRAETLYARGALSGENRDEARIAVARAANAGAQARQELARSGLAVEVAQEAVDELTIRAPISGVVTQLDARIGDMVLSRADSIGESGLLTITDTTNLMIEADMAETSIADLRPGLQGEAVLDGFSDQAFAVEVQRLAPVISAAKGTITLHLSLTDPPDGIRPNMAARIRIPLIATIRDTSK